MASTAPPRMAASVSSHSCRRARRSLSSCDRRRTSVTSSSSLFRFGAAIHRNRNSQLMKHAICIVADTDERSSRWRLDLYEAGCGEDIVLSRQPRFLIQIDHFKLAATFGEQGGQFFHHLYRLRRLET